MKTLLSLLIPGLWFITSCTNNFETPRESVTPEILRYNVETMMPGSMMATENHILWEDPFMGDFFLHVLNKEGDKLGRAVRRGNGPDEIITPQYGMESDTRLFAFDMNIRKQFLISLDSLPETKIVERYRTDYGPLVTRMLPVGGNEVLVFHPSSTVAFSVRDKTTGAVSYSFGTPPVQLPEKELENAYDYFQGSVVYDRNNDEIVYSVNRVPYMAIYKRVDGRFEKIKERALNPKDYSINKGEFSYDGKQLGAREVAVSKDYIVTIDRDRKFDSTDENSVGRDVKKLPTTVFVYNRDLELLKIVDTGIPLIRIAYDVNDNTIYAIGIETDHILMRFDIQ